MMEECGRFDAAKETRELDLAAGRREQIVAADHMRHTLHPVVHGGDELISPVTGAVAHQEIAALFRRTLLLRSAPKIHEPFDGRFEPDANAEAGTLDQPAIATRAGIPEFILARL